MNKNQSLKMRRCYVTIIVLFFLFWFLRISILHVKAEESSCAGNGIWKNIPEFEKLVCESELHDIKSEKENLYSDNCYIMGKLEDIDMYIQKCISEGYNDVLANEVIQIEDENYRIFHAKKDEYTILFVIEDISDEMLDYGMEINIWKGQIPVGTEKLAMWWNIKKDDILPMGFGKKAYTPQIPNGIKHVVGKKSNFVDYPDINENQVIMSYDDILKYIDECIQFGYKNIEYKKMNSQEIIFRALNEQNNNILIKWNKSGKTYIVSRATKLPEE